MKQSRHEKAIRAEIERIDTEIGQTETGVARLLDRQKALEDQRAMLARILDGAAQRGEEGAE